MFEAVVKSLNQTSEGERKTRGLSNRFWGFVFKIVLGKKQSTVDLSNQSLNSVAIVKVRRALVSKDMLRSKKQGFVLVKSMLKLHAFAL